MNRTPTNDSKGMEKHLILLDHTLVHWREYVCMKHCFTTLRWGIWCLKAPINTNHLLDYWHYAGPVSSDLYEIVDFAKDNAEKAANLGNGYHRYCWTIEWGQHVLYSLIFPSYSPEVDLGGRSDFISPHNARFLVRLVVASQPTMIEPSGATISRLYNSLGTQFDVVVILLAEQFPRLFLEPCFANIALQWFPRFFGTGLLRGIFCEIAYSSVATWTFLENLLAALPVSEDQEELFFKALWTNWTVLLHHFLSEALCEYEMDLWIKSDRSFNSVIRFIIASLVPYQWNDSEVSVHTIANMCTFEFLVRWALRSVRDAILDYEQDQRRRRSSDSSTESVSSSTESVS